MTLDGLPERPLARLAILADRRDVHRAAKGEARGIEGDAAGERAAEPGKRKEREQ